MTNVYITKQSAAVTLSQSHKTAQQKNTSQMLAQQKTNPAISRNKKATFKVAVLIK